MDLCTSWRLQPEEFLELKSWFKEQNHLPQATPDEYFAMILHSCYSDVPRAKKTIEAYFKVKTSSPQLFSGRSLDEDNVLKATKVAPIVVLQGKNDDGYSVIWGWLEDKAPENFVMEDILKFMYMVVDMTLKENPGCPGIIFVHDANDFSFRHLFRISINTLRKYFEYIQDACPIRVKGICMLNAGSVMTHTLNICKPFIYKEYANLIQLYPTRDFDNFLNTSRISLDIVPEEFGGNGPSRDKLLEDTMKRVRSYSDWFTVDETLRITKNK